MQTNIGLFLKKRADICPQREAFVEFERARRFTFAEVNTRCNRVANGLLAAGIQPGDRVIVIGQSNLRDGAPIKTPAMIKEDAAKKETEDEGSEG